MSEYEIEFEKLQTIINNLFKNNLMEMYHEDKDVYRAKDMTLTKRIYIDKVAEQERLTNKLKELQTNILSMKHLYVMSRSNAYEDKLRSLFEEVSEIKEQYNKIKEVNELFIIKGFKNPKNQETDKDDISLTTDEDTEDEKEEDTEDEKEEDNNDKKEEDNNDKKEEDKNTIMNVKLSTKDKKKIKAYLFNNYQQCVSKKSKDPTFMKKEDIVKSMKEFDSLLFKSLPKNISKMKKEEICRTIYNHL